MQFRRLEEWRLVAVDVAVIHVACVLIGAPFLDSAGRTLLFALLLVLGANVRPSRMEARRQALFASVAENASIGEPGGDAAAADNALPIFINQVLSLREQVFIALGLLGSLGSLLDWRETWIAWPLPSLCLVLVAIVTEPWWNRNGKANAASRAASHGMIYL